MYNRLNAYLADNNILFNTQFGFRADHSTEHALLELIDQISDSFNDKLYFLGIFIDFISIKKTSTLWNKRKKTYLGLKVI